MTYPRDYFPWGATLRLRWPTLLALFIGWVVLCYFFAALLDGPAQYLGAGE